MKSRPAARLQGLLRSPLLDEQAPRQVELHCAQQASEVELLELSISTCESSLEPAANHAARLQRLLCLNELG